MIKIKMVGFAVLLVVANMSWAEDSVGDSAAEYFQLQQWSEAIKAYQNVVKSQPDNEQAWYRLAQAHIHLQQGEEALLAIKQLSSAKQLPASAVLYQKAMALNLIGKEKAMWDSLDLAAEAGLVNAKDLENNSIWANYKNHDQFFGIKLKVDKNINPCMYDDKYRAFDFWIGEWEVYGNLEKTGPLYGRNSITRTEQGCLIMEQWQGSSGSTGTSLNYFNGINNQWVQHWVSGGGTVIDYSGGLINLPDNKQAMQLIGKIYYASTKQQPQIRDFRGTWSPLDDGVVQQFFEESTDGGKTWYVWFNGFYFPIKTEMKNAK